VAKTYVYPQTIVTKPSYRNARSVSE